MANKNTKEKYINIIMFFIPIFLIFIIFRDVFFNDRIYYSGDVIMQFFQYFNFYAINNGFFTQHILSGFPLHVTISGIWFYPFNDLFLQIFDPFDSYKFIIIFNLLLTYVMTWLYARKIGLRHVTSILVAISFLFSGQLMLWSTTATNTNYFFLLPTVLYLTELLKKNNKNYLIHLLIGLALGIGWLSGHIQFIMFIHAFFAVYYLYTQIILPNRQKQAINNLLQKRGKLKLFKQKFKDLVLNLSKKKISVLRKILEVAVIFIMSLGIGWFQIGPMLGFFNQTTRLGGVSLSEFFIGSYFPQDFIHYFLPFWSNPAIPSGIPNLFIGILPAILLFFAFVTYKKNKNVYFRFFLAVFALCLFASVYYSPLSLLIYLIPLLDSFRAIPRIMFIGNFAAVVVAGFTLEFILDNYGIIKEALRKYLRIIKTFFYGIFLPVVVAISLIRFFAFEELKKMLQTYFLENIYPSTSGLPVDHYMNLINIYLTETLDQLNIGNLYVITAVVVILLSIFLLKRVNRMKSSLVINIALVLVAINMLMVYGNYYKSITKAAIYDTPQSVETILNHNADNGYFRVFSLFPGISEYNKLKVNCGVTNIEEIFEFQKAILTPNINMIYGLDSIDGYDNFMPERVARLIAYVGSERATAGALLAHEPVPVEERVRLFAERKNVLKSMNVQFVLSHYPIVDDDFNEIYHERVGQCQADVYVYELKDYWPRYFTTDNYQVISADSDAFDYISRYLTDHNMSDGIVLEQDIGNVDKGQELLPVDAKVNDNRIEIQVETKKPSILFIGNTWLPGWQARVNGRPRELLRANYIYMALPLEGGQQDVELIYNP